jgi:hypothetical protein
MVEHRVRLVATVGAFVLLSVLVLQASLAAFTADTTSPESSWQAGELDLSLDHSATAMFATTGMLPGDEVANCIKVTYAGAVSANLGPVKLHGVTGGALAPDLNLTVEMGTAASGGGFGTCEGFAPDGAALYTGTLAAWAHNDYSDGRETWTPTGSPSARVFRFTVELDPLTDDTQKGESGTAEFTWEIQTK